MVKERSIQVFTELGEAEAMTHGSTLEQVKPFVRGGRPRALFVCGAEARVGGPLECC